MEKLMDKVFFRGFLLLFIAASLAVLSGAYHHLLIMFFSLAMMVVFKLESNKQ